MGTFEVQACRLHLPRPPAVVTTDAGEHMAKSLARAPTGGRAMSEQSRLKWTKGWAGFSIPLVIAIGVILLIIIGATTMM